MSSDILSVGHVCAFYGIQSKVRDLIDRRNAVRIQFRCCFLIAREGVEFISPFCLYFSTAEPFCECLDCFGLFLGSSCFVQNTDVFSDVIGAVRNVNQSPVLRFQCAKKRMFRAFCCSINLAVQRRRIEGGYGNIPCIQRIKTIFVGVIRGELAACAVLPEFLPAIDGNAAGR